MKPVKMTIKVREEDYIRVQIKDDPHTLYNLLKKVCLEQEGVLMAGYARDRTFEDSLMFQVRTDGSVDPADILINAANAIVKQTEEFKESFEDEFL